MSGLWVSKKLTLLEVEEIRKKAILEITEWFNKNPKRRSCKAEIWYPETIKVRKGTIEWDISKAKQQLIKNGRVILCQQK